MAKAILTTKISPSYEDVPELVYHFPKTYLGQVTQAEGDQVIYYEPRRQDDDPSGRLGRQSYFAVATIRAVTEDASRSDHYFAHITDYIDFDEPVPFKSSSHYFESALQKVDGSTNRGAFGRSVRIVPDDEFELIVAAGFSEVMADSISADGTGLSEPDSSFERPISQYLVSRPYRDAAFARNIMRAYDSTCSVTGLKIINGGGRTEAEAAHIKPVGSGHNGPDSVRNGLALCRTAHWMFDRGLFTLDDDYRVIVSDTLKSNPANLLVGVQEFADVPAASHLKPHRQFLEYHRDVVFRG